MKKTTDFIYGLRSDFETKGLEKATARRNPFEQFESWLAEAISESAEEANAMVLSTADASGKPSSRVVLLRGFDRRGFVFYTNYDSRKGLEIARNPQASLLFYWARPARQIRIEGVISKTGRKQSEDYFASRPRASQIGAWASAQSRVIANRRELEEKFTALEARFAGKRVGCPDFWGGYRLQPELFEFWEGGKDRLHDRLRYTRRKSAWTIERLSP